MTWQTHGFADCSSPPRLGLSCPSGRALRPASRSQIRFVKNKIKPRPTYNLAYLVRPPGHHAFRRWWVTGTTFERAFFVHRIGFPIVGRGCLGYTIGCSRPTVPGRGESASGTIGIDSVPGAAIHPSFFESYLIHFQISNVIYLS